MNGAVDGDKGTHIDRYTVQSERWWQGSLSQNSINCIVLLKPFGFVLRFVVLTAITIRAFLLTAQ